MLRVSDKENAMSPSTQIMVVSASLGFLLGAAGILFWEVTHVSIGGWATLVVYTAVTAGAVAVSRWLSRRHRAVTVLAYFMAVTTTLALHTSVLTTYSASARSAAISAASLD